MNRVPVVVWLVLASFGAVAATTDNYWVLGSFKREQGATAEQNRLAAVLDANVRVATFRSADVLYRVVVATSEVDVAVLRPLGVSPWRISVDPDRFESRDKGVPAKPGDVTNSSELLINPAAGDRQPGAPLSPAPTDVRLLQAGETILEYCRRRTGSGDLACDELAVRHLVDSGRRLSKASADLRQTCAERKHKDAPVCAST